MTKEEKLTYIQKLLSEGGKFDNIKKDPEVVKWKIKDDKLSELISAAIPKPKEEKEPKKEAEKIPTMQDLKIAVEKAMKMNQDLINQYSAKKLGISALKASGQHLKTVSKILARYV